MTNSKLVTAMMSLNCQVERGLHGILFRVVCVWVASYGAMCARLQGPNTKKGWPQKCYFDGLSLQISFPMYQICGTLTPNPSKAHFLPRQHTKYLVHGMCEPTFGTLSRFQRIWYIGSMYQIDSNLVRNWPGVMVLNSATNTDIVRD